MNSDWSSKTFQEESKKLFYNLNYDQIVAYFLYSRNMRYNYTYEITDNFMEEVDKYYYLNFDLESNIQFNKIVLYMNQMTKPQLYNEIKKLIKIVSKYIFIFYNIFELGPRLEKDTVFYTRFNLEIGKFQEETRIEKFIRVSESKLHRKQTKVLCKKGMLILAVENDIIFLAPAVYYVDGNSLIFVKNIKPKIKIIEK